MTDLPHAAENVTHALVPRSAGHIFKAARGLDGGGVDTTHISSVDGAAGELSYRGISIDELVGR